MSNYVEIRYVPGHPMIFRWSAWLLRSDGYPLACKVRRSKGAAERAGRRLLGRNKVVIRYRLDADS